MVTRQDRRDASGNAGARHQREVEHEQAPFVGENPKQPSRGQEDASHPLDDNRLKDPADWVTGDEPMTGAQKSYLKTLSEQVHEPEAYDPELDKAGASERIDDLKRRRDGG
jgi:hypothetical protein